MRIPMSRPDVSEQDLEAVISVLKTPTLSIGPRVERFERAVAAFCGAQSAVAVSSGTAGLHLSVIAAGISDGDLAVTTPFSFVASSNCLLYERAVPVFVDIEPLTLNIDPALVDQAVKDLLTGGSSARQWLPPSLRRYEHGAIEGRLKAILTVDAFGQPADHDPINETARRYGLAVIEDSCEALGAKYKGRPAGLLGDVGVFAFYPNKQMTTGEGGVIVTDRDDWAALFRSLRNQGRDIFDAWLNHSRLGYNYRLDEMSAALGESQMQRIEHLLANRERVANWYNQKLAGVDGVTTPYTSPQTTRTSWFVYVVRLDARLDRRQVMAKLENRGVPARPYFSPIHLQPFYRERFGYSGGEFPTAERIARSTLALPFHGQMTLEQVEYVCDTLSSCIS